MIEIGMNDIAINYGLGQVLKGAGFEIMRGDRAALVGKNGSGKTTLLKMIAGLETPDSGTVSIRKGATIGYLEQIPSPTGGETTTHEVLCAAFDTLYALSDQLKMLETEMCRRQDADALDKLLKRYAHIQNRFTAMDGYAAEERLNRVITGFGLTDMLELPFERLSGGQKTIVKLAQVILGQPDILLLDEPTNHLDEKTLDWFEKFLAKYLGTVVVVSHDRYFLDKVCTRSIFLQDGQCSAYAGNYSYALAEQERQLLLEFEAYKNMQKKIEAMEEAILRYRKWGAEGDNAKFFKKAKELEKRLEKLETIERPELEKKKLPIHFAGKRAGKEVLRLSGLTLSAGERVLLKQADLLIVEKEKTCLMGDNGTGKTTLIKAILGENTLLSGELTIGNSVRIGYIPQEIHFLPETDTVLQTFLHANPCPERVARSILAKYFFFEERVFKRTSVLSGGEKMLLKLAILVQNQVNFLILDEPTNHIDIDTRELLEEALQEYNGTLLFVSHDRYFINKIASKILRIEGQKLLRVDGNYDVYSASWKSGERV